MFLTEERRTRPVPLYDTWPFFRYNPAWSLPFLANSDGHTFGSMNNATKLEFCNAQLRTRLNHSNSGWRGFWRLKSKDSSKPNFPNSPPIAVPELSVASSGTYIARTLYGAFIRYWDLIYLILTIAFLVILGSTLRIAYTEDAPVFTGWRTINVGTYDMDKLQLCTRSVPCGSRIGHALTKTHRPLCFRLTVIYSRYVQGTIVFKRKHSEQIQYFDLSDLAGRFDAAKFDSWISGVIQDAMTVPYGSVWNLWHLTLT